MTREDSKYIEAICKTWGRKVGDAWSALPLLILEEKWATECIATMEESSYNELTPQALFSTDSWLPWFDFAVIAEFVDEPLNYWRIKRTDIGIRITLVYLNEETMDAPLIAVDVPFFSDGTHRFMRGEGELLPNKYDDNIRRHLEYAIWSNVEGSVAQGAAEEALRITTAFLRWLHTTDYYPVEVRSEKAALKSLNRNKPWKRRDLPRIVFMNQFPNADTSSNGEVSPKVSEGDSDRTVRGHPRKGHYRTLRAERFMRHPMYLKRMWFKATWVGPTETTYNGNRYKVLLPPDRFLE